MKSGLMPVASMALQMAMNSRRTPTQSLKPTGLPPESSRKRAMKCIISVGVENAEWAGGEMTSVPTGTPLIAAISGVFLPPGRMPPWPGLAPWESLTSIILTDS